MNKIIKKQVLATFALVTIMAGVLIGTNCIYAAQDGKETTTIRLINQTYLTLHQDVWYRKSAQSRIKLEKAYGLYYNFFVQKKL